jgi:hypothetical protein
MDGPRKPNAFHVPLGVTFHPLQNAKLLLIAWKASSHHMACVMCDESHEQQMETRLKSLLEAVENESPEK